MKWFRQYQLPSFGFSEFNKIPSYSHVPYSTNSNTFPTSVSTGRPGVRIESLSGPRCDHGPPGRTRVPPTASQRELETRHPGVRP